MKAHHKKHFHTTPPDSFYKTLLESVGLTSFFDTNWITPHTIVPEKMLEIYNDIQMYYYDYYIESVINDRKNSFANYMTIFRHCMREKHIQVERNGKQIHEPQGLFYTKFRLVPSEIPQEIYEKKFEIDFD